MPMISIYTISALRSGDYYKVERSDVSRQRSPPVVLNGIAMEDAELVRGTLAEVWNDLQH
jgi:hypothetical protein